MPVSVVRPLSLPTGKCSDAGTAFRVPGALMLGAAGQVIDRALRWLYAACAALAGLAIVVIAVAVLISIVSRLMGVYVPGTTEIAGYGMAAAGALGLSQTAISHGHVRVDLVLTRFRTGLRSKVEVAATLITTAVMGFAAWYILQLVRTSWRFGDLSSGSDNLQLWLPQLPMAIGFAAFALALMHMAVLGLIGRPVPDPLHSLTERSG